MFFFPLIFLDVRVENKVHCLEHRLAPCSSDKEPFKGNLTPHKGGASASRGAPSWIWMIIRKELLLSRDLTSLKGADHLSDVTYLRQISLRRSLLFSFLIYFSRISCTRWCILCLERSPQCSALLVKASNGVPGSAKSGQK